MHWIGRKVHFGRSNMEFLWSLDPSVHFWKNATPDLRQFLGAERVKWTIKALKIVSRSISPTRWAGPTASVVINFYIVGVLPNFISWVRFGECRLRISEFWRVDFCFLSYPKQIVLTAVLVQCTICESRSHSVRSVETVTLWHCDCLLIFSSDSGSQRFICVLGATESSTIRQSRCNIRRDCGERTSLVAICCFFFYLIQLELLLNNRCA
jgi:hypothetical protein